MHRTFILAACIAVVATAQPVVACSVPVFRYALENWEPDRLTVAVIHDGEMSDPTKQLVDRLELASTEADELVNLRVHPIDVSAEHPEGSAEALLAKQWRGKSLPHMLVYFSNAAPDPQLAWSASMSSDNVERLIGSPARQAVVERLLDGQSAVWVLLKTGRESVDQAAEETLRQELAKKPDEIELPSLTDLESEEKFNEDLGVEMRVEFSLITIDPDDANEAFFREMLLHTEEDLKDFDEPIAVPIYGRGRTYFALVGPGITADNIADNCNFICGACSCEVKRDNPGQDLLLAANWNQVQPGNWVNDTPLPVLTGIGGLEGIAQADAEPAAAAEDGPTTETEGVSVGDTSTDGESSPAAELLALTSAAGDAAQAPPIERTHAAADSPIDAVVTVGGWAVVLFFLGFGFTVWQRRRSTD